MAWNQSPMNKYPLFSFHTAGKGSYKWSTVEKAICLRVARRAVSNSGFDPSFEQAHGHRFTGSGADRRLLPHELQRRVDGQLVKSMRKNPSAWRSSPVARISEDRSWADNLILNQGLDYLASRATWWAAMGAYCVLGTGTATPAITQTGLGTEVVRTKNLLGSKSVTDDNSTRTRTISRTYDFPAESVNRNYAELGLSHTETVANNLSTRALISGGTVTVLVGQQARVAYAISVTLGANVVSTPTSTTGWTAGLQGTSGFYALHGLEDCYFSGGAAYVSDLNLSTADTIPTFGTDFNPGVNGGCSSSGFETYVTGSYTSKRWAWWDITAGIGTWRSLFIPTNNIDTDLGWLWVFDNAQTKDNRHTLTITWSMSFGRI